MLVYQRVVEFFFERWDTQNISKYHKIFAKLVTENSNFFHSQIPTPFRHKVSGAPVASDRLVHRPERGFNHAPFFSVTPQQYLDMQKLLETAKHIFLLGEISQSSMAYELLTDKNDKKLDELLTTNSFS